MSHQHEESSGSLLGLQLNLQGQGLDIIATRNGLGLINNNLQN